ncbi:UBX domain-containing protein 1-B [Anopheles ziemanni]|uniref:UBX domain-containing protein 1-B n=1 Tax=Anopheles coustani TaxID=139045 RepID=UPI002658F7B5|nr:UBX domain-containing protein 1-B [Anopheles coustani]XP_058178914.1 UBX domain-containing protein 1-B [Anopheles ziemanni]
MSDIQTLMDMGFPKEKAERALEVTNHKGVEQAMEWLLAHADEPLPPASGAEGNNPSAGGESAPESSSSTTEDTPVAKSLKCDECGKLFKSQEEVEFHAAKTQHGSFSESTEEKKPLTEEEKKAQLALLEDKMRRKRQEREENEKKEAMERERLRIKSGKDMLEAKRRMEEQEMKKLMDQRRREKLETQQARDRVRAQIESDRAARKAKDGGETTAVSPTSTTAPPPVATPSSTTPPTPKPATETKSYTTAKIALRMMDGSQMVQTFQAGEQLAAVRLFVQLKMESPDTAFGLMTNFPKRVFTDEEYDMPLDKLGLVPNAVLIVTKAP